MTSRYSASLITMLFVTLIAASNSGCGGGSAAPPPPPISVTISPSAGTVVGNSSVTFTAIVLNDPTTKGVNWELKGIGLKLTPCVEPAAGCGSLSNETATSVTYTAPSSIVQTAGLALQATSVADSTKSAQVELKVVPPPFAVTTNSLPNGTVNAPYSVTLQSSGGTSPITWNLSPAAGLPPGLSPSGSGTISGMPTTPGSSCFESYATDSSTPPQVASQGLCIGINSSDMSHNALLKGHYAFLINRLGQTGSKTLSQIATAGSFVADGAGNVTGVSDTNGSGVGVVASQTFTGTYALGADNRGTLSISTPTETIGTYAFSVGSISTSGVATKGRLTQFAAGVVTAAGEFELQDPSAFSNSTVSGSFAFAWADWSGDGWAGVFTADGKGSINTGNADQGIATRNQPLIGTYNVAANSTDGRGTGTLTIAGTTSDFAFYVVSASKMLMVSADPSSNPSIFSGQALKQSGGPFNNSSLSGTSVFRIASAGGGDQLVCEYVTAGLQAFDGEGTVTGLLDQNACGGVILDNTMPSFGYSVSSNGRVEIVTSAGTPVYVLYLASPGTGFILSQGLGEGGGTGFLEPQSTGPFGETSLDGNFFFGNPPSPLLPSVSSGVATLKAGSINATSDINEDGTLTFGQTSQDNYTVAANGRVTTGSGNQSIYIISPTKFLRVDVNPANAAPGIAVSEQ
jgi:hypothetical protein